MVTAMLFAGGIGARMKYSDMPKQFLEVGGKPIIIHTMEHFARHPKVDAIVVACKADWIGYLNELIEAFNVPKVKAVVPGGANGFDSIHNGVMATAEFSKDPEDIILICDGVRPMLSEELITNCIKDTKSTKQLFLLLRVLIHFFTVRTEKPAARVIREVQCTLHRLRRDIQWKEFFGLTKKLIREVLQTLFPQVNFLLSSAKKFIFSLARDSTLR